PFRIKSMIDYEFDLLLGTFVADTVNKTEIIRWDTISPSWNTPDPIDEVGVNAFIRDDNNMFVNAGKAGNIIIRNPWPGAFQTVWGDHERYIETYYAKYNKDPSSKDWRDWPYFPGDAAVESEDGYFRILGRVDDVINVAGHRLGTKELESACMLVDAIAEAAVVPVADELKGRVPDIYVSLKPGFESDRDISEKVVAAIEDSIGKIARPKSVHIVPDMPKTRSGKIMRRVLAAISNGEDVGDVTTLANPEIVEEIQEMVQGA
ncbi:MAG: AMP-binding protein, partial [Proteobacteria bacterium]|nr:AMP-binding protein [Pseudomonadota bacterium]